ncbi:MAG: PIN domain nuclease [Phormidesmis sp.]
MIFVDSSVWIRYFNGADLLEVELLDRLLGHVPVIVGDLILLEVLQGFRHKKDCEIAKKLLLSLDVFDILGKDIALKASQNYRMLRSQGITIRKSADVIIATFCIERDFQLLHVDRDFNPFEMHCGLRNALKEATD